MLLQNMTRTRRKLGIIIIDNNELLDRCLTIFEGNQLKPLEMAEFSKEWIEKENNGMIPDFSIKQIFQELKNGEVMPVICEGFGITKVINDNDICYVELKGEVLPFSEITLVDNPN